MKFLTGNENKICITIHAQPRASRTAIVGEYDNALKIAIQAPPVDGEANFAIVEFLAKLFSVPKRNVKLKTGETGKRKLFEIIGVSHSIATHILKEKMS